MNWNKRRIAYKKAFIDISKTGGSYYIIISKDNGGKHPHYVGIRNYFFKCSANRNLMTILKELRKINNEH